MHAISCNVFCRYPWGQEAFDKAKNEDKPIFLSGQMPFTHLMPAFVDVMESYLLFTLCPHAYRIFKCIYFSLGLGLLSTHEWCFRSQNFVMSEVSCCFGFSVKLNSTSALLSAHKQESYLFTGLSFFFCTFLLISTNCCGTVRGKQTGCACSECSSLVSGKSFIAI